MAELDHRMIQSHAYALINPLQVEAEAWQDLPTDALVPRPFQNQPHLMPRLLYLDALDFDARIGMIERVRTWENEAEAPLLSALLKTSASADRVRRHLMRCLTIRQPQGKHDLFRYYDPRVFRHFSWLLEPRQRDALLGPIEVWTWPKAPGDWHCCERREAATAPLRLSTWQQTQLARLGEVNTCLERLADKAPEVERESDEAPQTIERLLSRAEDHHAMTRRADRLLFAEQALRFHPRIHQHSRLKPCLDTVSSGQSTYSAACREFDDDTLYGLAEELYANNREPS